MHWQNVNSIGSKSYTCGHCGRLVASSLGYFANTNPQRKIYVCSHCDNPTFFLPDSQMPGVAPGAEVEHLPEDVESLYKEARNCVAVGAYTAAVLCARKLLMNIGVSQGAPSGKPFIFYVDHLADNGYVPPKGRGWVDHIRNKGNEATHEIVQMTEADAIDLITFSEMLLKFIYEFPNRIPQPGDGA